MNARNLTLATLAFGLTFWAWNLIGPLSSSYTKQLGLSPGQQSLLVATPVLVGSLGRIPAGVLTDKFGGRLMFTVIAFVSIIPTLLVGWSNSFAALILWGFFLGIAGTSFAVGIPFVNSWFEPARRGFATGMFCLGMGGTALSALFTPRLVDHLGRAQTHELMAIALAVLGAVMWLFSRNSPEWKPATEPALPRIKDALKLEATWQGAFLYAVTFGGFVAFSTYLPTVLKNVYEFTQSDAGLRTAGFSIAGVLARPLGGTLSDKIGPARVLVVSFAGTAIMAVVLAFEPGPELPAGTSLVLMAFFLGLGTGGVFALIARLVEPARVGTVTGLVGAAGGLGGYFPPLVMGLVYSSRHDYTLGYLLLALTAGAALIYTLKLGRTVSN
ncbi:MFS transporter [Nocardia seriolae]|uniref:MFS transporter n=1 Tax=Nocardia seriolae TaxID=37332 RepID=A0ABC9Z3T9_9NOCA|nr:MFS transporter [Nocardia seriolae]BEK92438.1 nitrate/nitrite transporter [Nocardia seriolae]GAM49812.1 MFS transporter [Nocardia seriolae]GAP31778.1 MFS transporter [Nocardia seriolae]